MADFNVFPYFDDYDESKGYYKVLFRPSVAIQAREVNQLQTMLQKQIERFGSHIFREGSIVLGGAFDLELDMAYVKATAIQPSPSVLQSFVGKSVTGVTSGVRAYIRAASYDSDENKYVFLIRYTASSTISTTFLSSEIITVDDDASMNFTADSIGATGPASMFSIEQGVVFSKGYFIAFPKQSVIIDRYSSTPTATIGLQVDEDFITELTDPSLLSNAIGYPDENAPGAHRYRLETSLSVLEYKTGYNQSNFIPLMDIKNGVVETSEERSQYARIYDELAKRTYDESGDYYVNGFGVRTREHLDNGVNEGLYTANNGGDGSKLSIDIEPGVAYVKGYEVNKLVTEHVITDKATAFNYVNNQLVNARTGGYFLVNQVVGSVDHDSGLVINLYDSAETRITNKIRNTQAPTGKIIGTARVKATVYESGILGRSDARMRAYLYDFKMLPGYIISDARAIGSTAAPNQFFADIVLDGGNAVYYENNNNVLLFPLGSDFTRSIRSNTGSTDTNYQFNRSEDKTANFDDPVAITTSVTTTGEFLSYAEGPLSVAEKRELIVSMNGDKEIRLPGTVTGTTGNNTLQGFSTDFTKLSSGDRILVDGDEYYINTIANSSILQFTTNLTSSPSSNIYYKTLRSGDILDLTANGSLGVTRTANVSSGILVIDLKEDATYSPGTAPVKITYRVNRPTAQEIKKILRPNRFVKIQTSNNIATSIGPYNLGIPDVLRVRQIRLHSSPFITGQEGTDVTSSFVLDNGQTDNLYDHARIRHTGSLDLVNKFILVELDHFEQDYSSGFGYFSVDSYPVNDAVPSSVTIASYEIPKYISSSGVTFNLRNVFDFRPVKSHTSVSSVTVGSATTNPPETDVLRADPSGLRLVAPDTDITADYSFYLARRDVVTIDRTGNFGLIKGEPSPAPISPYVPDNVMALANIFIPPYPSISETLARIINDRGVGCVSKKIANIRHTMREIGVLKNRIENLEYYNALTLLEKSAIDLKVIDEDGLDRFKNGFFVDGFIDHSLGDTRSVDYRISIDKIEQVLRPKFKLDSFKYKLENSASFGYQQFGNLITRPFVEVPLIENRNVTTTRNIEQSVFRFVGTIDLTPDSDVWCDTTTVDKTVSFGDDIPPREVITSEWGSWETYAVGYNVYRRGSGSVALSTSDYTTAWNDARYSAATYASRGSTIETVSDQLRTGVNTVAVSETQIEEIGNFVTDVSVIPYIRPQIIRIFARGLKANTKFNIFFDGENMNSFLAPAIIPEDGNVGNIEIINFEGSEWRSNEYGEVVGFLRLPDTGKRFRIGTKEVVVTDSPTNAADATSYARSYFTASGLTVQKQNTIISTKYAVIQQENVSESRRVQSQQFVGPSCMAYSFLVDVPPDEDGIFLPSVDIWVDQKHADLGIWFEIREMDNAGGVTRTQVPYSEVWLKSEEVNLWNGTAASEEVSKTTVRFPAPVFLMNDTQYAFIIHTEGLNPDYYFWVSRLGENDILTGDPVTSRQLTGTLYTTNNNLNYDIVPDVDLKIRFNRCQFATGSATVVLGNQPTEFIKLKPGAGSFLRSGERVVTSDALSLSNTMFEANSITIGDIITGNTSAISGNVISVNGSIYYTDASGFIADEYYTIANSSGGNKSISGNLTLIESGSGTLRKYDFNENLMIIDDSNGKFYANAVIRGVTTENTGRIESFEQFNYSTTTLKPVYLTFNKTSATFEKMGWQSNVVANSFSAWYPGSPDAYSSFEEELTILSYVNEIEKFGPTSPNSSARVRAILGTSSEYVSPVIDISRAQSIYVHNILNNDATGETNSSGGNLSNKYLSKPVTLGEGQDAEDLLVKQTVYRPPHSDVKVWMKIRHNEDGVRFEQNPWIEMKYSNVVHSSDANKFDFIEVDYTVPDAYKNGNGIVQYVKGSVGFVANTVGVNASANALLITDADTYFAANDEVYYGVPPGNPAITPLVANTYYYISTVNSTAITLSATPGGAQINITDFSTNANAPYHYIGGDVFTGYKQFAVKVGLMGTNSAKPPRVGDLRAIGLQL